ncbi:MAG: hypothetical protein QOK39_1266 [Acidimicrobiaceae bacterium]|nr:hypothetical protein [Acidimicrobiaceae bacterium]
MFRLTKPSPEVLRRFLDEQRSQRFTYDAVGATAAGDLPAGFHHDRVETDLGADEGDRFARAWEAVRHWAPQRGAGIEIFPDTPVVGDLPILVVIKLPVMGCAVASARVAYVVDEPTKAGFAYGTLPGHPERGEEAFLVVRRGGRVVFQVVAFSKPRDPIARLGGPVARAFQLRTIKAYLRAMETAIG